MHAAIRIVLVALGCSVATSGCGPRAAEPPPAEEPAIVHQPIEDEAADEAWPEEPAPAAPALGDHQLDAMDRSELEAACYAGSSAACDRLGH